MCLIIYAPANVPVPANYVKNAFNRNKDGAGFAFLEDNKVVVRKGFMTVDALEAALAEVTITTPRIIHFRFTTAGATDELNCHPFELEGSLGAMAHNGPCVSNDFKGDKVRSDTRHFVEDLISKFTEAELFKIKPLLGGFINSGNKLAFLFPSGEVMLVNEKAGTWQEGLWLSNTYSVADPLPPIVKPVGGYKSKYAGGDGYDPLDLFDGDWRDNFGGHRPHRTSRVIAEPAHSPEQRARDAVDRRFSYADVVVLFETVDGLTKEYPFYFDEKNKDYYSYGFKADVESVIKKLPGGKQHISYYQNSGDSHVDKFMFENKIKPKFGAVVLITPLASAYVIKTILNSGNIPVCLENPVQEKKQKTNPGRIKTTKKEVHSRLVPIKALKLPSKH